MSWLSDRYSDFVGTVGNVARTLAPEGTYVQKFIDDEIVNKRELRGAEIESMLSGFPIVGNFIRGVEGVNQLEDLYRRTGKIPAYPGQTSVGASGIGKSIGALTRKIENGTHDLAEYYSGEKLGPMPVEGKDYVTGDKFVNE